MFLTFVLPVKAQSTDTGDELRIKMDAQKNAVMVNELLHNTFQCTSSGYIYPQNFAGTYIDDDILYILWTTLSDQQRLFYNNLFIEYEGYYTYKFVEYSYNELQKLCEDIYSDIGNNVQITSYGVDVLRNCAKIGIAKEDWERRNDHLKSLLRTTSPIYYTAEDWAENSVSLMGGTAISSNGNGFTLGMCGTFNGQNAVVSCGHNMTINEAVKYSSTTIGTMEYIQTTYGDYSIILTNNNATLTNRVKTGTSDYVEIEGTISNPPVGSIVCKYGRSTGYSEYGEVIATGQTIEFSNTGLTIRELTTVSWDQCAGEGGDSGGPYIMEDYEQTVFCGVHSGGNGDGTITYFTPYYFISAAGFDAKIE